MISSRTPEGDPHRCTVCGNAVRVDPSADTRDGPCPCCGHLLWFPRPCTSDPTAEARLAAEETRLAVGRLIRLGTRRFGPPDRATALVLCALQDLGSVAELEREVLWAGSWDEVFTRVWESHARNLPGAEVGSRPA